MNSVDVSQIVASTEGFTGADLKRTVEDGKALYAFDRVAGNGVKDVTDYYLAAAQTVREGKEKYAEAEARANATRPTRPVWFNPYSHSEYYEPDEDD